MDTLTDTGLNNRLRTKPALILYHTLRLMLVTIFLWSGIAKAFHPADFTATVGAYGLLPDLLAMPVALALILAEMIAAIGLLFEKWGALTAITFMMVLFIGILSYGIYLGLDIDCGCFGPEDPEAQAFHNLRGALMRDLLLMLAIGYLYLWRFINRLAPTSWLCFCSRQALSREV